MKINKIRAKNFLSFGEEGISIDFSKYGNIVLIKGQNLDVSPNSSNGAGKSSIFEIIVYGLYGKIIKGLNHKEAVNKKNKKGLVVEVEFENKGKNYKVIRTRKPDNLEFICLDTNEEHSRGGATETQKAIEETIRLNADAFINVACFGEHNNHAFLSLDAKDRRAIVENLLGLEKYVKYNKKANAIRTTLENEQKVSLKQYENLIVQQKSTQERISILTEKNKNWKIQKEDELKSFCDLLEKKKNELNASDDGSALLAFHEAKNKVIENKNEITRLEANRLKITGMLETEIEQKILELTVKKQDRLIEIKETKHIIDKLTIEINALLEQNKSLAALKNGIRCKTCYGMIDKNNYENVRTHNCNKIESLEAKIAAEKAKIPLLDKNLKAEDERLTKMKEAKSSADIKLNQITKQTTNLLTEISELTKIKEPNQSAKEIQLKEQINALDARILSKKEELINNPYKDLLFSLGKEIETIENDVYNCKKEIDERSDLIPYYEFWVNGFGDRGIRSFIIEEKLPALNSRINYWLQFLIENKIQLNFDKEFEAIIERNPVDGDPFVYYATSGGERRRVNLAISQAFSHLTMISADNEVGIMVLDEVAINIDLQGVHGVYKMINELARDRQVFVTTHCPMLLELLDNCDTITVVKKNGFSTLANV
jgi:DNA repair exonuclease SbcCD ATPase subunit